MKPFLQLGHKAFVVRWSSEVFIIYILIFSLEQEQTKGQTFAPVIG